MLKILLTTLAMAFAQKCPPAKLKLRDCHLQLGVHKVQVWNDKIFVQDEFKRGLVDLPLNDAEWVEVSMTSLASRSFLQFIAWDLPQGQGEVASKKWYVYELKGNDAILLLEKLVQRRKRIDEKRFKYDKAEKFGLSVDGKKVKWYVAKEKGVFE